MTRIAWFSAVAQVPLLRSAHFSQTLLAQAPSDWEVEIFVEPNDYETTLTLSSSSQPHLFGFPVFLHHQHFIRHRQQPFDVALFHVEDRPETAFAKRAATLRPGIIMMHDLNLSRLQLGVESHSTNGKLLESRVKEAFGEGALPLGEYQARGWSFDVFDNQYAHVALDYHEDSLIVTENARALAELSNRHAKHLALSATPVRVVQPGAVAEARRLRRSMLGIEENQPVIGFAGRFMTEDRVGLTIEAFSALCRDFPEGVSLLWLVHDLESERSAYSVIDRYRSTALDGRNLAVKIVRLDDANSYSALLCVPDVMVGLKFDALRGIPLIALLAMARGIPTVMSYFGPSAEIPSGATAHVPVGRGEREILEETLKKLLSDTSFRNTLGQAGREYVETIGNPASVLEDLQALINQHRARLAAADEYFSAKLAATRLLERQAAETRLRNRIGELNRYTPDIFSSEAIFGG